MKRFVLGCALFVITAASVLAQADLQPLVIVKLNKSETITLKQLRTRVEAYQKQNNIASFSVAQKKEILDAMVDEKLVIQAAQKTGMAITDTQVNQYFLQSLSQQVGKQITEAEFADMVKKQMNLSLDDFMRQQVGLSVAEYKAYLKNQLLAQQYVMNQKQDEIKKVAPTDEEIRSFYEMNKASFVQNDMLKMFLVVVPKGSDAEGSRTKAMKLLNDIKDKKTTFDDIKLQMQKDPGNFQAGDLLISKTAQHAQQLGITYQNLIELFTKDVGYLSELNETDKDFQFYSIRGKFPAKMLSLSDLVQPETTLTVYDYVKQNLTQQKQSQYLIAAIQDITKSLDTPENVERKKTGDALDALLAW
jgi:hypothetical protein